MRLVRRLNGAVNALHQEIDKLPLWLAAQRAEDDAPGAAESGEVDDAAEDRGPEGGGRGPHR